MNDKPPRKKKKIAAPADAPADAHKISTDAPKPAQDDEAVKEAVLGAVLSDAAFDGFTESVLAKAGKAAGLDKDGLARLFPDGPLTAGVAGTPTSRAKRAAARPRASRSRG